ncbi:putative WD40 repeat protein [Trypanosoma equiperdum]|uniref:Histone-binding protein RBBP4-like N-terminal domain-containing protein n=2 Tax=Trypanozoon TaxID=39700 RepID=D0A6Z2_TRYB9|nr:hypothetical protein, conserved [Trypanosoma brucei gambiense DAL972]CBH17443.1 hypothetical protein, conserved [Trypanosoma brucei gambiense DAL972]SCU66414.1 predicted WD40 repeat protein [Trypanosoma equiperdum]|eukprot:XP_011779707.1 hypothetical protein, conserved [Trypanosoma brucei gambiense DAL972]
MRKASVEPHEGGEALPIKESSPSSSVAATGVGEGSYQETKRYRTWRKHTRDLYQRLTHIDLVWESPAVRLMPFSTSKPGLLTRTLLCCTRACNGDQSYLQLLSVTTPSCAESLDATYSTYCEATGEVGGYGMAPSAVGLRIERSILHDGEPLTARYMHANPLIIASGSKDGNAYVFDWSRISLNKFPNDPPRPRAPLPPNEPSEGDTGEERALYNKRMSALQAVVREQDRWDKRHGEGQHLLTLTGGNGPCGALDWSTTTDGTVAAGSLGRICVWQIANMSKDDPRVVSCVQKYTIENESRVNEVSFSWMEPTSFVASVESGAVLRGDIRDPQLSQLFRLEVPATSSSVSPLDGTSLLVGSEEGEAFYYDLRYTLHPVMTVELHEGAISSAQWCPHSRHLFCTGGEGDAMCCVYNVTANRLLFKHAGHVENVTDVSWDWQEGCEGQLVSADAWSVMLWRPRDIFYTS